MAIIQSDTKKSLVTVINYDFYQKDNSKKRHPENQNEQKEPQKSDSDATVLNQEYQEVSQLEENKKRQQCDSDATAMHTNNNVNNENNLNKLTNNNNESPKSFLEELEEDEAKQASNMKLIEEIEREYQARKGEDPELPPHDNDIRSITNMVNENKFTREEIFDGINYAFLTAAKQNNTVFSFNYCITSIISQKEYKQKQKEWNQLKQQKKTSNNTPDSKLPIAIREQMEREERERQGIKEPEPSPEEVSKQRAKLKEMLEDMGIHREDLA
ncbi:hypothetical protein [Shimazuella kribbensis]|uniref:hypothetical protein n=1 Tax=Shimazuella kribbensis TaxID=139808 RepID=UPI001471CF26|nr:hypothetical protein [Shimazuella kribbensis]